MRCHALRAAAGFTLQADPVLYRSHTTATEGIAATVNLTKPTGTASGDLLVFLFLTYGSGTDYDITVSPVEFMTREVVWQDFSNTRRLYRFTRVAGGSEGSSYNFVDGGGDAFTYSAICVCFTSEGAVAYGGSVANYNTSTSQSVQITPNMPKSAALFVGGGFSSDGTARSVPVDTEPTTTSLVSNYGTDTGTYETFLTVRYGDTLPSSQLACQAGGVISGSLAAIFLADRA